MRLGRGQLRSKVPPKWWYPHHFPEDHNLRGNPLIYFKNICMELKFQLGNKHDFTSQKHMYIQGTKGQRNL